MKTGGNNITNFTTSPCSTVNSVHYSYSVTLDTVLMMVNFGPYISQFGDDQRQLVVGGGTAQAPELKSKKEQRLKSYILDADFNLLSSLMLLLKFVICSS